MQCLSLFLVCSEERLEESHYQFSYCCHLFTPTSQSNPQFKDTATLLILNKRLANGPYYH